MAKSSTKEQPLPGYEIIVARLTGLPPGMMHDNGDRADPLDPIARVIDALRKGTPIAKRTYTYHYNLAKAGYIGALWVNEPPDVVQSEDDDVIGVGGESYLAIPGNALMSMMAAALGRQRRGGVNDAKLALLLEEYYPMLISGKIMTAKEAFEKYDQFAKRIRLRNKAGQWITATRPVFRQWEAEIRFEFQTRVFDRDKITKALNYAGSVIGIGTSRPRTYGRFTVEVD